MALKSCRWPIGLALKIGKYCPWETIFERFLNETNISPLGLEEFTYDNLDRLVDQKLDSTVYAHITYDSSDRLQSIYDAATNTTAAYERDVQGRLKQRAYTAGGSTTTDYYGYTASGDTPDFVTDAGGNVTEKYLTLPGGALVTIRPNAPANTDKHTYSLPNIHGDVMAVTDAAGALKSTTLTGPFGEKIAGQANPANALTGTSYSYTGQHQKLTESSMALQPIQMGERTFIPSLGRFLQVDPIEGGVDNNYVYPTDPVNDFDLTGQRGFKAMFKRAASAASWASAIPGPVGMAAASVSAAAYAAAGDRKNAVIAASGIALAAVGVGGAVKAYQVAKSVKTATTVARLGQMQKIVNSAGKNRQITGYSKHAIGRMAGTGGAGRQQMSPQAVNFIVKYGKQTLSRDAYKYSHYLGNVFLSKSGRVITVTAMSKFARYIR